MMDEIYQSLGLKNDTQITGTGVLPSRYAVTELAVASIGAVGAAIADLTETVEALKHSPIVTINQRLASLWFGRSIYPIDWELPPAWDAIAGDYPTKDGWIKLHTNLPHHKAAALQVLDVSEGRNFVAQAVRSWHSDTLEQAIKAAGGVAAMLRSRPDWQHHPQGQAVAQEPLISWSRPHITHPKIWVGTAQRPLKGLKVLDLTRVLAGPVATRTLAGFGAEVLRIDPPEWEETNIVPDITLGKRCARLDLTQNKDRHAFEELLAHADILVHGYRPGALAGLGYDEASRAQLAPDLLEVSLCAYGWTGPWTAHRGFDSLVQMSSGIADAGRMWAGTNKPTPLPVQALDHATGYLMAAAAIRNITYAYQGKIRRHAKLSLARTAELLTQHLQTTPTTDVSPATPKDMADAIENTAWGQARRLQTALTVSGIPMLWPHGARALGSSEAKWTY